MFKKGILLFTFAVIFTLCRGAYAFDPSIMSAETITLNSRGLDVVDVLQLISEKGHFNLSVSSLVSGKVTLFLRDVTVDEAFDIVLKSADLVCEIDDNITYIMTPAEFRARYGRDYRHRSEMKVFKLENLKADKVEKVLAKAASKDAEIISDEETNTIVLYDQAQTIKKLSGMVQRLDTLSRKDSIEMYAYPVDKREYYFQLVEKLRSGVPRWYFKSNSTHVRVRFALNQYGELEGLPDIMSFSVDKYWQDLARKIVVESAPFAPFSSDMKSETEIFEVELAL